MIAITGACGFIGQAVVRELLQHGYGIRALTRSNNRWPFCDHAHLTRCIGDMRDIPSLENLLHGCDVVIHLAARKNDEVDSEQSNVEGAKHLVHACKKQNVSWIINISSQSAKLHSAGRYGKTKRQADAIFHTSSIPTTTLMMSLVYGAGQSGTFARIVRLASLPITPLIGRGDATFQPMHVDDVATMIRRCIETPATQGKVYDAGGSDYVSLRALIILMKKKLGKRSLLVPLPIHPLLAAAYFLSFLPSPPITISNIRGAMENISMDVAPLRSMIEDSPRKLDVGLEEALSPLPYVSREAGALLAYCMKTSGIMWNVTERDKSHYRSALQAYRITGHRIDEKFLRRPSWIAALDLVSILQKKKGILRQKLQIAAAIIEAHPVSAPWLLPQNHSLLYLVQEFIFCIIASMRILPLAAWLLLTPTTRKRNAGL